jgi:hypothetical protein
MERVKHAKRLRMFHMLQSRLGFDYRFRFAPPVAKVISSAPQT